MAGGILRSPAFRIGCAVFALALLLRLPMSLGPDERPH